MNVLLLLLYLSTVSNTEDEVVLILARGGSKGIRLKNLQVLGGVSLLARTILTARGAGFKNITVSTDHPIIALEGLKFGASIFHRSAVTATDWAPSIWGAAEFLFKFPRSKILILMQATSPFIRSEHLRNAFRKLNFPKPVDCVFSATRSYKLRWKILNGKIYALNFKYTSRPRRQDWAGEFIETGAFYISRVHLIKNGFFQNNK